MSANIVFAAKDEGEVHAKKLKQDAEREAAESKRNAKLSGIERAPPL